MPSYPYHPFGDAGLTQTTQIAMWVGMVSFACIFFLASTVASKITIEQLRGDIFFSVGDALRFLKGHWKSVFGAFIGLLLIQIFLAIIPLSIAGIAKLPAVGKPFLMLTSLLMPIGFFPWAPAGVHGGRFQCEFALCASRCRLPRVPMHLK